MTLSLAEIERYALAAGWPASLVPTIAAITMPESQGNPGAVQQGQPWASTGWGLAQITPGGPQFLDPLANLQEAYRKFLSAGGATNPDAAFASQWTTYAGGQYKSYMAAAQQAFAGLGNVPGQLIGTAASAAGSGIDAALTSAGHGLANALGVGVQDAKVWVLQQLVALVVTAVVLYVLFS